MFKANKKDKAPSANTEPVEEAKTTEKASLWNRGLWSIGNGFVNVLAGVFNATAATGVAMMMLATQGDDPLDGLNNILTNQNIQALEQSTQLVSASALYPQLLENKKYTFYGDMSHTVGAVRSYFFGAENTQNIINADVKHVFIEYPQQMQNLVDDLASGTTTKDEFVDEITAQISPLWWSPEQMRGYHKMMADMIVDLNEAGIKMHFADPGMGSSGMSAESKDLLFEMAGVVVREMEASGVNASMSSMEIFIATQKFIYGKVLADPNFKDRLQKLYDDFFEKRLGEDNEHIASFIQTQANDEKSVILYGAAHMMREHDLDEMLGAEDTQLIGLYGDKRQYGDALIKFVYSQFLPQQPDKLHMLDEQQVYLYEDASQGYTQQPSALKPQI